MDGENRKKLSHRRRRPSSARKVILQGERTQVWRKVMVLTGLFTGTVMFITSGREDECRLHREQETVTAAKFCLPLVTAPFPAACVILRCMRRYL